MIRKFGLISYIFEPVSQKQRFLRYGPSTNVDAGGRPILIVHVCGHLSTYVDNQCPRMWTYMLFRLSASSNVANYEKPRDLIRLALAEEVFNIKLKLQTAKDGIWQRKQHFYSLLIRRPHTWTLSVHVCGRPHMWTPKCPHMWTLIFFGSSASTYVDVHNRRQTMSTYVDTNS